MDFPFYTLSVKKPNGEVLEFNQFKGKTVLIVNTATKCGLAHQFEDLEALHRKYKPDGLVVLGFPCNQFRDQEPETNDTMEKVCLRNHKVTFQLTEKIDVNGQHEHPVYTFLKSKTKAGFMGNSIKWNFTKFLIDKQGNVVKRYPSYINPLDMEKHIKALL